MNRVVKLNGQWSDFEIGLLTEMVVRGDLLAEIVDTLDRSHGEIKQKSEELGLLTSPRQGFSVRAA
jgi:hypothetical protein